MRNWKFQENNKKIQKNKKFHNEIISSQSRLEKDGKNEKIKNYRFVSFLPDE